MHIILRHGDGVPTVVNVRKNWRMLWLIGELLTVVLNALVASTHPRAGPQYLVVGGHRLPKFVTDSLCNHKYRVSANIG